MTHYRVHPFHVHQAGESRVLVTAQSVVRLTDPAFARMLDRLQADQNTVMTEDMLEQRTSDQTLPHEATRDYLLARGILQTIANADERITHVHLVSADEAWRDMLQVHLTGVTVTALAQTPTDILPPRGRDYPLWVLLLPTYSRARITDFQEKLRGASGASGLIAYIDSGTLHVSSVYTPAYRTPCHFCHVGWDTHARSTQHGGSASFFALMRRFEDMGEQELPRAPLLGLDQAVACAFLVKHIQQLTGAGTTRLLQEDITTRQEFDLRTFSHTRHAAVHWPGCDCQYIDVAVDRAA